MNNICRKKVLSGLVFGLFVSGVNASNIELGIGSITTGNGSIAIGNGAVATGDNQTEAQIKAILDEQRNLAYQISNLKNSIDGNEKLNQKYLDLVSQMDRNQNAIKGLEKELENELEASKALASQHSEVKKRYETQTQIIADKKDIISRLDLSKVTGTWETDGGLDSLAQDFKKMAEAGTNVSLDEAFYKDYLKSYVNVATKVNHEGYKFDSESGTISHRWGSHAYGTTVLVEFEAYSNEQKNYKVDFLGGEHGFSNNIRLVSDVSSVNETMLNQIREGNEKNRQNFLNNFDKNIEKIRASSDLTAMLWTDEYAAQFKKDVLKEFDLAETSVRYKELELKLYKMDEKDPNFSSTFKEFEDLKLKKGKNDWGSDRKRVSDDYAAMKKQYKAEMIIALQEENAENIKKLNSALDAELTDISAEMKSIDSALSANQKLIAQYEKDIQNRQPTAEEKAAYEEAKKIQEKLDLERALLLEKERDLADLQKEMNKGKNAIAFGTEAIATGENSLAFGKNAEAFNINSIAIGSNAQAKQDNALAIGAGAIANAQAGDVALGFDSVTDKVVKTASMTVNKNEHQLAGSNPASTVSIGSQGKERTLTNLAAGAVNKNSTDAINGSQLFFTNTEVDNVAEKTNKNTSDISDFGAALDRHVALISGRFDKLGSSAVSILGGGAKYDSKTGAIKAPSYQIMGVNHNNVGDALAELDQASISIQQSIVENKTNIGANQTNITHINNGLENGTLGLVQQDAQSKLISIGKAKGGVDVSVKGLDGNRTISGVANGDIAKGSNQAVNGEQVWLVEKSLNDEIGITNANVDFVNKGFSLLGKNVAMALGSGSAFDESTGILSLPAYEVQSQIYNDVGGAVSALDGAVNINSEQISQNKFAINNNQTQIININSGLENGTIGLVQQDASTGEITVGKSKSGQVVNMSGSNGARVVSGVANGEVIENGSDAINGGQIYQIKNDLSKEIKDSNDKTNDDISLTDGKTNQLGRDVAAIVGGGSSFEESTGMLSEPKYLLQGKEHNNIGSALMTLDGQIDFNTTNIKNLNLSLENGTIGLVKQNASTGEITVGVDKVGSALDVSGLDGNRTISGVADGEVSVGSTQAINGSQLWLTEKGLQTQIDNISIVTNNNVDALGKKLNTLGTDVAESLGGDSVFDEATGSLSKPSYTILGDTHNNVGSALTSLDNGMAEHGHLISKNEKNISILTQNIELGSIGLVQQNSTTGVISLGHNKFGSDFNIAGLDGNRTISGVANGSVAIGSTQAVNGGQLWLAENRISNLESKILTNNTESTEGLGKLEDKTNNLGNDTAQSLGGGSVFDEATGSLSKPEYIIQGDSFNNVGDSLTALDSKVTSNVEAVSNNTTNIKNIHNGLEDGTIGLVQQDPVTGSITVGKGKGGDEVDLAGKGGSRVLKGVSDGDISKDSKEAVNGGQIYQMEAKFNNQINETFKGLDGRFNDLESGLSSLNDKVNRNRKNASQGIAAAMAMQIDMPEQEPDAWAGGVGVASYDGQTAMAVSVNYLSSNGRHKFSSSVGGGLNQGSKPAAKVGWGFLF